MIIENYLEDLLDKYTDVRVKKTYFAWFNSSSNFDI